MRMMFYGYAQPDNTIFNLLHSSHNVDWTQFSRNKVAPKDTQASYVPNHPTAVQHDDNQGMGGSQPQGIHDSRKNPVMIFGQVVQDKPIEEENDEVETHLVSSNNCVSPMKW